VRDGEPALLVIEILTDHANFGKDGENDAARMAEIFDVLKVARDRGITPFVQVQTPKHVNDQADEDITLDMFRGSGGLPGHFDIALGYKQPRSRPLRRDVRYFKILRNRLDGLPERDGFWVQQINGKQYVCHDQVPKPDIKSEVLKAIQLAESESVNESELLTNHAIRKAVNRNLGDVRNAVLELEEDGVIRHIEVDTGKRGPKPKVYVTIGGDWDD
jgi:hypothetical protein